jgi:hypothetical protein
MNKFKNALFEGKIWPEMLAGVFLLAIFVAPIFALAGHKKIYVDDDASGEQNGSADHPYKTISEALEHSDEDDEIHVADGEYRENIHLRDDRELFGESKNGVVIKAKDDDYETVDMDDDTEINKVTIKGGEYGIRVGHNEKASIVECVIKDNEKDGIILEDSNTSDKYKVSITKSEIKDNGRSGVYSATRRLVLIENEIHDNDKDGVDIEAGSRVWLEENRLKDNDGTGLKLTLDGSEIWTDDNSFSENDREGVEINAYGGTGRIDLHDSSIHGNDRWGIARVQRGFFSTSIWNGLTIRTDNRLYENKFGNVSDIIRIK